jgi:hypothetical protein
MPVICSQNVRQRSAGSGPRTRITSVPGSDAAHTPTVGHTMERLRSLSRRTWERFGIDLGECGCPTRLDHRADRGRSRVAGIVPTRERGDQDRIGERDLVGVGQPVDVLHAGLTLPAYRGRYRGGTRARGRARGPASGARPVAHRSNGGRTADRSVVRRSPALAARSGFVGGGCAAIRAG